MTSSPREALLAERSGLLPNEGRKMGMLDTGASVCYDYTDLTVVGGLLGFIKSTM